MQKQGNANAFGSSGGRIVQRKLKMWQSVVALDYQDQLTLHNGADKSKHWHSFCCFSDWVIIMYGTLSSKRLSFLFADRLHMNCHSARNLMLLWTKINRKAVYQSNLQHRLSGGNNEWLLKQLALINSKKRIKMNIGRNFRVKGYNLIPENDIKNMIHLQD